MATENTFAFVVYHTDISPEGIEEIGNIYPEKREVKWKERWQIFKTDYLPYASDYIEVLFKSARLSHPGCKCVVLTDKSTPFSFSDEIEVCRFDLNPERPAYNRLLAQKKYLKKCGDSRHIAFLDYDMLIQENFGQLFSYSFDIALTHDSKKNLIGGSFIVINKKKIGKGEEFLSFLEKIYLERYTAYEAWGGVQVAMNDFVKENLNKIEYDKVNDIEDIRILILPAVRYNYPFSQMEMDFLEFMPDKMILHFKGIRKKGMMEYWNSYLRPRKDPF